MGRTVYLRSPKELPAALRKLGKDVDRAVRVAAYKAALRGTAMAAEASPRASNALATSWRRSKLKNGAVIGSRSEHAYFVEVGRKPGKPPPADALLDWIKAKGLTVEVGKLKRKRRKGKRSRTKRARLKAARFALALRIARSIGKNGTEGQYVLQGIIPAVGQHFRRTVFREIDRVMSR